MQAKPRLNFEYLTIKQLRRLMEKLGKNHNGMDRKTLIKLLCVMTGQIPNG